MFIGGQRRTVLLTRPVEAMASTAARLHDMGFAPVFAPLLQYRKLPVTLPDPSELQAVLVTSARALAALDARYHGVKLLAVGDSTADHARALRHRNVQSAGGDATDLLRLARVTCTPTCDGLGDRLLLLSGEGEGAALAAALAEHFTVEQRFVYAMTPVASLPEAARQALVSASRAELNAAPEGFAAPGTLSAALFFSAATAEVFVTLAEAAGLRDTVRRVEALAISVATAAALARLPWRDIRVAFRPNQDELLALLR
jgi:uroporphyrinogen-III synthase